MDLTITPLTPADLDALVASVAALFAEDGAVHDPGMDLDWAHHSGAAYYAGLDEDPDGLGLLARVDGAVVGHLVGRRQPPNPLRPTVCGAELESMRVAPSARGRGVGRALVERFRAWAADRGATELRVTAFAGNATALAFYRGLGFTDHAVTLTA